MAETSYRDLSLNGLWKNNPAIVQLLGLCPLLAVTGTVVNALGLAAATTMVLVCSNTAVSLIRNIVSDAVRLPAFVMIIASFVTCINSTKRTHQELHSCIQTIFPATIDVNTIAPTVALDRNLSAKLCGLFKSAV